MHLQGVSLEEMPDVPLVADWAGGLISFGAAVLNCKPMAQPVKHPGAGKSRVASTRRPGNCEHGLKPQSHKPFRAPDSL